MRKKRKTPRTTTRKKTAVIAPKLTIITVTFDKDLRWLKYSLRSRKKYCEGYHGDVIILDDHEDDCLASKAYLEKMDHKYVVNTQAKLIKIGYVRQQYMKFFCDEYVDKETTHIVHVDSDSIFTEKHDPSIYFKDGKPIMLMTPYSEFFADHQSEEVKSALKTWQDVTSMAMDEKVDYEFMRRMPLVYPVEIHAEMRDFFVKQHGKPIFEYLYDVCELSPPHNNFTEYNFMGAYCWKFHRDKFHWIDTTKDKWDDLPLHQYWSHANIHDVEEELTAWIDETADYRKKNNIGFTRDGQP